MPFSNFNAFKHIYSLFLGYILHILNLYDNWNNLLWFVCKKDQNLLAIYGWNQGLSEYVKMTKSAPPGGHNIPWNLGRW